VCGRLLHLLPSSGCLLHYRLCGPWRRGWGIPPLGGGSSPVVIFFLL
jgi:hypothetical protein